MAAPLALMGEEIPALRDCRASSQCRIGNGQQEQGPQTCQMFRSKKLFS